MLVVVVQEAGIKSTDKLRLALIYLLTAPILPSDSDFERIERIIEGDVGQDLSALRYSLGISLQVMLYATASQEKEVQT